MTLGELFRAIGAGTPPPQDGRVVVVPRPERVDAAIIAFTDHAVVATDVDPAAVEARLDGAGPPGVMQAEFVSWLAEQTGTVAHGLDVLWMAPGSGDGADGLRHRRESDHPRVQRARRYRPEVDIYEHPAGGVLVLGRGIAGRRELAFEVDIDSRNHGLGRNLVAAALALTPHGEPVFAQVAPGNVASMRAILAAGFVPVGAEILLVAE